jgi:hypothetical protein
LEDVSKGEMQGIVELAKTNFVVVELLQKNSNLTNLAGRVALL